MSIRRCRHLPEVAEEGGFIGYGPRIVQLFRDVLARQLVKSLQSTKPNDVPVEQPTKFELVINLQRKRWAMRCRPVSCKVIE
jgi:ABC-type uncharacterized transport system substrate-binding protein